MERHLSSPQVRQAIQNSLDGGPSTISEPLPTEKGEYVEIIVTKAVAPVVYGSNPVTTRCPFCYNSMTTLVETKPCSKTHLLAILLCQVGCCLCSWYPYYNDTFQSKKHFCTSCNSYLGEYRP
ncbi:uncharacterized protein LOC143191879 [Rhynchophorus ferrugineus]|uniref:LITAF domain-containing protein n=1 Tax=Rhynchophorus ferrugineus TaxID=354439 RepID=A0A834M316_RHYFE|nr:hypothetical protein GWI33_021911 [Rhynchophorus ferrugineus]KAF7264932.1 hypothetical protein GWI33_021909 [Rhynchophorus ferrugineus]